jgi:hypothetical protein
MASTTTKIIFVCHSKHMEALHTLLCFAGCVEIGAKVYRHRSGVIVHVSHETLKAPEIACDGDIIIGLNTCYFNPQDKRIREGDVILVQKSLIGLCEIETAPKLLGFIKLEMRDRTEWHCPALWQGDNSYNRGLRYIYCMTLGDNVESYIKELNDEWLTTNQDIIAHYPSILGQAKLKGDVTDEGKLSSRMYEKITASMQSYSDFPVQVFYKPPSVVVTDMMSSTDTPLTPEMIEDFTSRLALNGGKCCADDLSGRLMTMCASTKPQTRRFMVCGAIRRKVDPFYERIAIYQSASYALCTALRLIGF